MAAEPPRSKRHSTADGAGPPGRTHLNRGSRVNNFLNGRDGEGRELRYVACLMLHATVQHVALVVVLMLCNHTAGARGPSPTQTPTQFLRTAYVAQ